jgi:hypothetical protein
LLASLGRRAAAPDMVAAVFFLAGGGLELAGRCVAGCGGSRDPAPCPSVVVEVVGGCGLQPRVRLDIWSELLARPELSATRPAVGVDRVEPNILDRRRLLARPARLGPARKLGILLTN